MKQLVPILLCALLVPVLWAQGPTPSTDEILRYRGTDREAKLVQGAKREGRLSLYTSLAPTESQPLAAAFEKKYGIKVELWRALSDQVTQRTITEARARRYAVDVVETNSPEMEKLTREKILAELYSPYIADLPPNAIPAHRTWFPDRMNYFIVGFNTTKVKKAELPATFEGFVDPKWKGRIGLEASDTEWMATLSKTWGHEKAMDYFRKLAALKPDMRRGHVLLASLVAAGEVPIVLNMYQANVVALQRKGAPIDFVPVQPVVARPQGLGVARNAPHPHAALLFTDFVLSPEGQRLFESMGRVPSSTRVKSALNNFPFTPMDPATVLDESQKWENLWKQIFLRP